MRQHHQTHLVMKRSKKVLGNLQTAVFDTIYGGNLKRITRQDASLGNVTEECMNRESASTIQWLVTRVQGDVHCGDVAGMVRTIVRLHLRYSGVSRAC